MEMSNMNSILWEKAEKKFDLFHLYPTSMQLEQGSIMGLIGENGSGKTTLIKLVFKFLKINLLKVFLWV